MIFLFCVRGALLLFLSLPSNFFNGLAFFLHCIIQKNINYWNISGNDHFIFSVEGRQNGPFYNLSICFPEVNPFKWWVRFRALIYSFFCVLALRLDFCLAGKFYITWT